MGSLLSSVLNSASALGVYDRALSVVQNNVTNAQTPGYVRQIQSLKAQPFDPVGPGQTGGVGLGPLLSARDEYAEQAVRSQQQLLGEAEQKAADLSHVEPIFSLQGGTDISSFLDAFFQSFAQLAVNPNDPTSRQTVLDRGSALVQSFHSAASRIQTVSSSVDGQTRDVTAQINTLSAQVQQFNLTRRQDSSGPVDPGLDAQVHQTLEQLSDFADVSALQQTDGTWSVYLGGQSPLVIGEHQYPITADFSSAQTRILNAQGDDATGQIQSGKLRGLLDEKNSILPSYTGDLNTLAQTIADQVNTTLAGGLDRSGAAPSVDFFQYDLTNGAAGSLALTGITPDQIAAASSTAPGGNGNALAVAQLANAATITGQTFTQFYGALGSRVGQDIASAKQDQDSRQSLVTQARSLRDSSSAVSLDAEAARLIALQQSYQAVGKLVTVLDTLTQTVIGLLR